MNKNIQLLDASVIYLFLPEECGVQIILPVGGTNERVLGGLLEPFNLPCQSEQAVP